jgi:putative metallohydrolase (TIGR04338 family)
LTKLQQSAYDAQLAAGLPASQLGTDMLIMKNGTVDLNDCARYLAAVRQTAWFTAAFPAHNHPITVVGGRGVSHTDAREHRIKIAATDRRQVSQCEHACLHELAHLVSSDYRTDGRLREPRLGQHSSKGHHHAWRANLVLIVRMVLGKEAATRLRREFNQWGLPTAK